MYHRSPDKPAKLTGVTATAGNAHVTLSWDAPPSADNVVSYEYRIDPDPVAGTSDWTLWQNFTSSTNSHTVSGLTNGTTYSFQVRANNSQGSQDEDLGFDTVTATPTGPPAAPDLRADPGDGEVRLYWANPDDSSITKYQKHEKKGDEAYGLWEDISFPDTVDISSDDPIQYTVTGLDNDGTAYTFQVRAFNNGGIGAVGTATATPTTSETAPAQMSGLIAAVSGVSGGTGGQVRFTWGNPGDSSIDKYQYRYDGSSSNPDSWDRDWTDVPSSVGTTTSYPAGAGTVGLHGSSKTVFYEFRAVNDGADVGSTADVNEGGGPATAVRVDRSNTPTTSAQPPATPTDLTATATPGQVALGWTVPSGTGVTAPTNHEYRQSTDGGESFGDWMSTGKATAGHTVSTLTDGQEYTFEVRGFTGSGDSKVNGASTRVGPVIPGAPNAPTLVSATQKTDDATTPDVNEAESQIVLIWTPGTEITGVTVADYEYRQSVSGAVSWSAWNSISGDGSETTYTVIELLPSTTYSFELRAVAGALKSDPSDSASGTTADPPTGQPLVAPVAPMGLRAAAGNEQATLTWSNPDNRYILRYRYRVALEGTVMDTVDWKQIDGSDKDTTSYTITGLINGTTYSFQVQAVGAGSMIGTASETVTAAPRPPPTGGGGTSVPQRDSVTAHSSDETIDVTIEKPASVTLDVAVVDQACNTGAPDGSVHLCVQARASGAVQSLVTGPAIMTIEISPERWSSLRTAYAAGRFYVYKRSSPDSVWQEIPACQAGTNECYGVAENSDGSATITVSNITSFSQYAITTVGERTTATGGGVTTRPRRRARPTPTALPIPTVEATAIPDTPTPPPNTPTPPVEPTPPPPANTPKPPATVPPPEPPSPLPPTEAPTGIAPTEAPTGEPVVQAPATKAPPPPTEAPGVTAVPPPVDTGGGFPGWLIAVIIVAVIVVAGLGYLAFRMFRQQ